MKIFRRKDKKWDEYIGENGNKFSDKEESWKETTSTNLECGYVFEPIEDSELYFTYDEKNNNVHICYRDKDDKGEVSKKFIDFVEECDNVRKKIIEALKENVSGKYRIVDGAQAGHGNMPYTKGHRYFEIVNNAFSYMICFQSLYCDNNNRVSCDIEKIQFHAFSAEYKGPNFDIESKFKMTYPSKNDDEKYDNDTNHCVRNTEYYLSDLNDEEKRGKLINGFVGFVNEVEANRNRRVHYRLRRNNA